MSEASQSSAVAVEPAATVVLLRDGLADLEVLLLRRSKGLAFYAGAWVFPGGRVDPGDYASAPLAGAGAGAGEAEAARSAAVREVHEEAGLALRRADLLPLSRWTTPRGGSRRFRSWFFVARAPAEPVRIDHGEIDAHRWMTPGRALDAQRAREMDLPPATFVTLLGLSQYRTVNDLLATMIPKEPEEYLPRTLEVPGGKCSLYQGDAGYERLDPIEGEPRHRLWMLETGWRYERSSPR